MTGIATPIKIAKRKDICMLYREQYKTMIRKSPGLGWRTSNDELGIFINFDGRRDHH